jgi:peroxiredoxin
MSKEEKVEMWLNRLMNTNVIFIDEKNIIKYGNISVEIDKEVYKTLKSIKNPVLI